MAEEAPVAVDARVSVDAEVEDIHKEGDKAGMVNAEVGERERKEGDKKEGAGEQSEEKPLSRNQQKKKEKFEKQLAERPQKRKDERKRKQARKRVVREEQDAKRQKQVADGLITEEEIKELESQPRQRMEKAKDRKVRTRELMATAPKAVIDLTWEHLMTPKEIVSLSQQVRLSYGLNIRSQTPLHMHLTSTSEESRLHQHLLKQSGFDDWPLEVKRESYMELFPRDKVVYLTAESDTVLEEMDAGTVYCIGGIVDHNRLKSIVHDKALELGLTTRRLPIEDHLAEGLRKVITVNQVFAILLSFWECKDWKAAVEKVLPPRWQKQAESSSSSNAIEATICDGTASETIETTKMIEESAIATETATVIEAIPGVV
jgi:tRNA (guanine9-N1)-methyltransferase